MRKQLPQQNARRSVRALRQSRLFLQASQLHDLFIVEHDNVNNWHPYHVDSPTPGALSKRRLRSTAPAYEQIDIIERNHPGKFKSSNPEFCVRHSYYIRA